MRETLLALVLVSAMCGTVLGNTGVFFGSGHDLQLVKSADVQMVSEDITMTPICGRSLEEHAVDFRCEFVLKNRSDKAVHIQAGFPLDRESHGPPKTTFDETEEVFSYHFIARDASNTYHVRYVPGDPQGKYKHIFLWDMDFAAGETKTLHVGYLLPMSYAAFTTRKMDEPNNALDVPEYEKPWHVRIEPCMLVHFCYITETGQSWAGPIESATFRFNNKNSFEDCLRTASKRLDDEMAAATEAPIGEELPGMGDLGFVVGMKLGTLYPYIRPTGWKSADQSAPVADDASALREPDSIVWHFENYKPGTPLEFKYYFVSLPETVADCDRWVQCVLGKNPPQTNILELREILAAFFGVAPHTTVVKDLAAQQVWYDAQRNVNETDLSGPRRAVLARLDALADKQKNVARDPIPTLSPLAAQEPGLRAMFKGHAYQVMAVAFSPDGKMVASCSGERKIKLWDAATGKNTATLKGHDNAITAISFSRIGTRLASADFSGTVKLWDVVSGKNTATLDGHADRVEAAALTFGPDGKTVASGSLDTTVKIWDATTGKNTTTLRDKTSIRCIAFSPDGLTVASGGCDKCVKLWNVASGERTATLEGHTGDLFSLAYSPDGKTLASASGDDAIKLWDVATARNTDTLKPINSGLVLSVAFSPDGKILASGNRGATIQLWDTATHEHVATLGKNICQVDSLAFSPDGQTLASTGYLMDESSPAGLSMKNSEFNTVKLWDVAKAQRAKE